MAVSQFWGRKKKTFFFSFLFRASPPFDPNILSPISVSSSERGGAVKCFKIVFWLASEDEKCDCSSPTTDTKRYVQYLPLGKFFLKCSFCFCYFSQDISVR